ncbi:MAG: ABC transporter permease [Defluviitaleaceae bacterium]|nr:ABC transporter permease [Defluviitaleaceae bacterium]
MTVDTFLTSMYGSLGQGLLYAPVVIGVFMSLRIMKKPDLTVEGTFAFGAVIAMTMLNNGSHFLATLIVSLIGGGIAGLSTALIHTKLKIDGIISGLLVTMALFSINLFVMGGSTISAPLDTFIFAPVRAPLLRLGMQPFNALLFSYIIVGAIVLAAVIVFLYWLYSTMLGLSIRATGDNERMACSIGVSTDARKIISLVISNAITGLAGGLVAQQQSGANVNSGTGVLIIGLASLVIGEIITPKNAGILTRLLFISLGSFIYFTCISLVIISGLLSPDWTRLLTAALALGALCVPKIRELGIFKRRATEVAK